MITMSLPLHEQRDGTAMALRICIQDITPAVKDCRSVVKCRLNRPDVYQSYLYTLRCLTEAQERALELGMEECPLAAPIAPLGFRGDEYHWEAVLEHVRPKLANAA